MPDFAFVDVNIVPMDAEHTRLKQTVLIREGRIERVGPTELIEVPAGTEIVQCRGRWLMPGLADMHAHYGSRESGTLFLANGVTTIRIVWGRPEHLKERDAVESGERLAPTIVCASPIIDGDPPTWGGMISVGSPGAVEATLDAQIAAGYDFIKIYNLVSRETFDAMMTWSRARGVPVAGHLPHEVPLQHALRSGFASIEHAHASFKEALRDDSPIHGKVVDNATLIAHAADVDERKLAGVAEMAAALGGTFCPTLVVNRYLSKLDRREDLLSMPELRYVHPKAVKGWDPATDGRFNNKGGPAEAVLLVFAKRNDSVSHSCAP